MTRVFMDTEFLEDGRTIQLISIGLVKETGESYYAETPAAHRLCFGDQWLMDNVQPHLETKTDRQRRALGGDDTSVIKGKYQIANEIVEFVGPNPEFWAYYGDYDWVALCQLYGRMIDLPKTWPMLCLDVKQLMLMDGITERPIPELEGSHNALTDAYDALNLWLWTNGHNVVRV